jgi:hypothetical protein
MFGMSVENRVLTLVDSLPCSQQPVLSTRRHTSTDRLMLIDIDGWIRIVIGHYLALFM